MAEGLLLALQFVSIDEVFLVFYAVMKSLCIYAVHQMLLLHKYFTVCAYVLGLQQWIVIKV